ncbi:molybdopterin-dependent oxidoreductase, partial [Sandarakinorhabdus oryzae]|uniref:molybdopterin-dependent oxidoreductase n=1 Tax=Sandarakinorhabdus oryzae TaxID=2675220 RepID=UPI0012E2D544
AAGLPSGEAVRGPALTTLIVAEAADGYRVAFSLGEIDGKLGNRAVLVATACDGKPLDIANGPLRLVVPGETRAARSVRQLKALRVVRLP